MFEREKGGIYVISFFLDFWAAWFVYRSWGYIVVLITVIVTGLFLTNIGENDYLNFEIGRDRELF